MTKFRFLTNFRFLTKIQFLTNFRFLTKIQFLTKFRLLSNFHFWPKITFWTNFDLYQISIYIKFRFLTKIRFWRYKKPKLLHFLRNQTKSKSNPTFFLLNKFRPMSPTSRNAFWIGRESSKIKIAFIKFWIARSTRFESAKNCSISEIYFKSWRNNSK